MAARRPPVRRAGDSAETHPRPVRRRQQRRSRDWSARARSFATATTGVRRAVRPGDIAILFRTRESHREFEDALERRGLPSYVYKGLGFFDADEIKDVLALLWYLADPLSNLRAAAWLRSRFVRISDEGLRRLAPSLAEALRSPQPPPVARIARCRRR